MVSAGMGTVFHETRGMPYTRGYFNINKCILSLKYIYIRIIYRKKYIHGTEKLPGLNPTHSEAWAGVWLGTRWHGWRTGL